MNGLAAKAQNGTDLLIDEDVDQLYERLGLNLRAISVNPEQAGHFDLAVAHDVETLGPLDGLTEFGRRYFRKVEAQIHALICNSESHQDREKLTAAFGLGRDAVAATIAALLVSSLGLAPAIAVVLAPITIKLFFVPAREAMCEQWDERLADLDKA